MQKNAKNTITTIAVIITLLLPLNVFAIINVQTGNAKDITDTNARLLGSFNPEGKDFTTGYFRYSTMEKPPIFCNDIYGSQMKSSSDAYIPPINNSTIFQAVISNLLPNTTYYYCAIGSSKTEIRYGGVKSFTTKLSESSLNSSIKTKDALVASSTSAYLSGFYNTDSLEITTWFEYKKSALNDIHDVLFFTEDSIGSPVSGVGLGSSGGSGSGTVSGSSGYSFTLGGPFGVKTESKSKNKNSEWQIVGKQNHNEGTNGKISFLLGGLSPNTTYNFKAMGATSLGAISGKILTFTTLNEDTTDDSVTIGVVPGGTGYTDPCADSHDINCNGTGSGGTYTTVPGGIGGIVNPTDNNFDTGNTGGTDNNPTTGGINNSGTNNTGGFGVGSANKPVVIGTILTPPPDDVVRFQEGIETVFKRQIVASTALQKMYGYDGIDLNKFSDNLADILARAFGYVSPNGREIRVSPPDIAAYELYLKDGKLTVYEYYNSRIVDIRKTDYTQRHAYDYEYFFNKR